MTYTEADIEGAYALRREYDEAYERGEEPHFPHEAQRIIDEIELKEAA